MVDKKGLAKGIAKVSVLVLVFAAFGVFVANYVIPVLADTHSSTITVTPNVIGANLNDVAFNAHVECTSGPDPIHEVRIYEHFDFTDIKCLAASGWFGPFPGENQYGKFCLWTAMSGTELNEGESANFQFTADAPATECCRTWLMETRDLNNYWVFNYPDICIDTTPPETTKSFIGPYKIDDSGREWIDGVTLVELTAVDPIPHPAGVKETWYKNEWLKCGESQCEDPGLCAPGGLPTDPLDPSSEGWTKYIGPFLKEEECCHKLLFYSVDNVGNVEDVKANCFYVDKTPPIPSKSIGDPQYGDCPADSGLCETWDCLDGEKDFFVTGRYGDENPTAGAWELAIWEVNGGENVVDEDNYGWVNGVASDFSLSYDPSDGSIVFTVDGKTLTWTYDSGKAFDYIVPFAKGNADGNIAELTNMQINGNPLPDITSNYGVPYYWGLKVPLTDSAQVSGFTLTGEATLTWSDVNTINEQPAFQVFAMNTHDPDPGDCWVRDPSNLPGTPITLGCVDPQPHPSGDEEVCYKVSYDLDPHDLTDQYCPEGLEHIIQGGYEGDWCCVDAPEEIIFVEDSLHDLEYFCRDAVDKKSEIDLEWFKVDSQPPIITKTMIGTDHLGDCPPVNPNDVCYVRDDGQNGVHISVADDMTYPECAVDKIECRYELWWEDNPQKPIKAGPLGEEGVDITFTEDSTHTLEIWCEDALGNNVYDKEEFLVDSTPPETTKIYGDPTKLEKGYRWITSDTPITLTATDEKVGVDKTYWRNTLLEIPDEACLEQCNCESPLEEVFDLTGGVEGTVTKTDNGNSFTWTTVITSPNPPHNRWGVGMAFATSTDQPAFQVWYREYEEPYGWYYQEYTGTGWHGWGGAVVPLPTEGITATGDHTGQTFTITVPKTKLGDPCGIFYWGAQARTNLLGKYPDTWTPWVGGLEEVSGMAISQLGGLGDWNTYDVPFYKPEESCHLIEFYSVDLLGNKEEINYQCVFVDNTPPVPIKETQEPKIPIEYTCSADLTNPGFETGDLTDWTVEASPDSVTVVTADAYTSPLEGTYMVRLGDDNQGGSQPIGDNTISQWFTVTEPTLTFAYNIFTYDYTGFNHFGYKVIDETDYVVYKYDQGAWGSPSDTGLKTTGWQLVSLDVSAYMGQQLQLVISSGGTGDTLYPYWTYVDCGKVEDWYVTQDTTISLECVDPEPHPVEQETIYWRFSTYTDGFDGIPTYSEWYSENYNEFPVTIKFPSDCWHDLEYYCVDHLGNEGEVHTQYYIVDTVAPVIEKTVVGPQMECPVNGGGDCTQIDGVTEIHVDAYDPVPHPVNDVMCTWHYEVTDGQGMGGEQEVTPPFVITFPEESTHVLTITCWDALGNTESDVETFIVDKTAPETIKTYVGPQYPIAVAHPTHITSETEVWLDATDSIGPHDSGVAATWYRDVYLDNPDDWHYCYEDCGTWEVDERYSAYGLPTAPEPYNPKSVDPSWEEWTGEPFHKEPESCHIIEYYSIDGVDKVEKPKWQCVFVDNTPPTPVKEIGEPKSVWDGTDSYFYPEETAHCWDGTEDSIDCWKVTMMTHINMSCIDPEPHPVDHEGICYKVGLDGDDATDDYCDGELDQDGFCCVEHEIENFFFGEETEHELEFYCIDALGNSNKEDLDIEKFKVEGTKFEIPLYKKWNLISVPFVLLNDDPTEVFKNTTHVMSVWSYDGSDWKVFYPDNPGTSNLEHIVPGDGYWVLVDCYVDPDECEIDRLVLGGSLMQPKKIPPSKPLVEGWNLIGYYGSNWQLYEYMDDVDYTCGDVWDFQKKVIFGDKVYCSLNSLVDTQEGFPRWSSLWSYVNCGCHNDYWIGLNTCPVEGMQAQLNRMYAGRGYWIEMDVDETYVPATTCVWNDDMQCVWSGAGGMMP